MAKDNENDAQKEWEKKMWREQMKAKLIVSGVLGGVLVAFVAVANIMKDDAPAPQSNPSAQIDKINGEPVVLPFTPGIKPDR